MNKVLEVKSLTKKFDSPTGEFTAVNNLTFHLKDGEILGFLGVNGAGKTTTIQMLLGVMTPTEGEIFYFGKPFKNHREESLKKINYSSGYISLPWLQTVEEILTVFAMLYEIPDRKERIKKLLGIFEIEEFLKKQFYKLSAGQRSRVLLAKAFLNYPKIILLDEPTASLDPDISKKVRDFLKKEKEEFNVSMLFTSHNMQEVEEMCDRIIFIHHGKITKQGTPSEIAQGTTDCKLKFMIIQNKAKALNIFEKKNIPFSQDKNYVVLSLSENKIAEMLTELGKESIRYEEIEIEKPDLEDYFIQISKNE